MNNLWNLSERELEVLQELAAGTGTAKQIARKLGLSDKTVELHFQNATRKKQATSRTVAVLMFDRAQRQALSVIRCEHCAGLGFVQKVAA